MVARMRVLAVDVGTSNTAAMVRTPDGRHRALLFDGAPLMPSAVYLTPGGAQAEPGFGGAGNPPRNAGGTG
jgi:hypothetical protein